MTLGEITKLYDYTKCSVFLINNVKSIYRIAISPIVLFYNNITHIVTSV